MSEFHNILQDIERKLLANPRVICFRNFVNASDIQSYYENQFANNTPRPMIAYNLQQDLYYFLYGPRLTPGKRKYPVRIKDGALDGSQPEFFYTTTQAVDYSPIIDVITENSVKVLPEGTKGWPIVPPFYLYLCQEDNGGEGEQVYAAVYRYVKIDGDVPKLKVTAIDHDTGIITFSSALVLDELDLEKPYYLVYFDYPVDEKISKDLTLFLGDETHESVTLGEKTEILAVQDYANLTIRIGDLYNASNEFVERSFAIPTKDQQVLILLTADSGTVLKYDEVTIKNVVKTGETEELIYEEIDSFYNINVPPIDDPFEDTGIDVSSPGEFNPDVQPTAPTGKIIWSTYDINISPFVNTLDVTNFLAYYSQTELLTSDISDEELSIPLPGTEWSIRPHTFHTLSPMKASAYIDLYNFNWANPLPYPEATVIEDCEEAQINGFLTPKALTSHRLFYRREKNVWNIGGIHIPTLRSLTDSNHIEDCIVKYIHAWYFKIRSQIPIEESETENIVDTNGLYQDTNEIDMYHMHIRKW